jgi:hypothetical protein
MALIQEIAVTEPDDEPLGLKVDRCRAAVVSALLGLVEVGLTHELRIDRAHDVAAMIERLIGMIAGDPIQESEAEAIASRVARQTVDRHVVAYHYSEA